MKLLGIVPTKTSEKSVAIATEPPISDEVAKQLRADMGSLGRVHLKVESGILLITGAVFPPKESIFTEAAEYLRKAYETVEQRQKNEERAHKSLVDQYAKASGLPIL